MLSHAPLQPGVAATVLSRTQAGVTAHLPPIREPVPIANLAINHHAAQGANAARLASFSRPLGVAVLRSGSSRAKQPGWVGCCLAALSSMQALGAGQKCAASTSWSSVQSRD